MKVGFYPGSFNPWHEGHQDILEKALKLFDKIVIFQLTNPDKSLPDILDLSENLTKDQAKKVLVLRRENTFLRNVIGNYLLGDDMKANQYAIIRGLRNSSDLEYEKVQQYWNEDLGIAIPFIYFVADRKLVHISSSAIRMIDKFMELENARASADRK